MDIAKLRREATARAIANEIDRVASEHAQLITTAIRENNRRTGVAIDSALRASAIRTEVVVTRQTQADRRSLYDHAETNPALARAIRRLQGRVN